MKRNANTATVAQAAAATAPEHTTTERKSAGRSTPMRKANTATVTAIDTAWKFTPANIALNGHVFDADKYAIADKGDVYVLAKIEGAAVRIHVGKASPVYHAALEAAVAFKAAAETKPAETKPAETKPALEAHEAKPAPATKPAKAKAAKAAETKSAPEAHEAKPAPATKPAKAKAAKAAETKPVTPAMPADNALIGTAIEGKGWRIAFDEAAQRTRVIFAADPSAKQRAAIDAAGFWWSATTKSWNKKLTRKAQRAAMALAETLNALDA